VYFEVYPQGSITSDPLKVSVVKQKKKKKGNENDCHGTLLTGVTPQNSIHRVEPSSCDAWSL